MSLQKCYCKETNLLGILVVAFKGHSLAVLKGGWGASLFIYIFLKKIFFF